MNISSRDELRDIIRQTKEESEREELLEYEPEEALLFLRKI